MEFVGLYLTHVISILRPYMSLQFRISADPAAVSSNPFASEARRTHPHSHYTAILFRSGGSDCQCKECTYTQRSSSTQWRNKSGTPHPVVAVLFTCSLLILPLLLLIVPLTWLCHSSWRIESASWAPFAWWCHTVDTLARARSDCLASQAELAAAALHRRRSRSPSRLLCCAVLRR
jgi:hypothetical protein